MLGSLCCVCVLTLGIDGRCLHNVNEVSSASSGTVHLAWHFAILSAIVVVDEESLGIIYCIFRSVFPRLTGRVQREKIVVCLIELE